MSVAPLAKMNVWLLAGRLVAEQRAEHRLRSFLALALRAFRVATARNAGRRATRRAYRRRYWERWLARHLVEGYRAYVVERRAASWLAFLELRAASWLARDAAEVAAAVWRGTARPPRLPSRLSP